MKNRLFTFGCSFTQYRWPTWADILSQEYSYFQNWGKGGAGNHYIFYSLVEFIARNDISKDDTIIVMWTSVAREDRYLKGKWFSNGSIYNSKYPKEYIKKFTDPDGYLVMNLALIHACKEILEKLECKYHFLLTVPLLTVDDSGMFHATHNLDTELYSVYKETITKINEGIYEYIFQGDWHSRSKKTNEDKLKKLKYDYNKIKQLKWLDYDDYINATYEESITLLNSNIEEQYQFRAQYNKLNRFDDMHLTPMEHFEYLEHIDILPLSNKQKKYAEYWNFMVLNKSCEFSINKPKNRF